MLELLAPYWPPEKPRGRPRLSYEKIAELLLPGKSRAAAQQMVERGRTHL